MCTLSSPKNALCAGMCPVRPLEMLSIILLRDAPYNQILSARLGAPSKGFPVASA